MAYDDGFYYGQCKIICEAETTAYNGKTVTITAGSFSKSGVIANKLFECIVPGRGQYTISVLNGGTVLWSGTVEAGYGECIHQMLADGYEAIVEKKKLTLAEIEAAPGSVADYVPDADAVKTLNSNLTANSNPFRFGYDSVSGKYGYILPDGEGGADSLHFFSAKELVTIDCPDATKTQKTCRFIIPANSIGFIFANFSTTSATYIYSWTDNITILVPFNQEAGLGVDFCIFKNDDNQEKVFTVTISTTQCYWGARSKTYVFE